MAIHKFSPSGQNCTARTGLVLPDSSHDNENDSGIPRRRAPKKLGCSAADRRRSCSYPADAPWQASHWGTAPSGSAISGWSPSQSETASCSSSGKTTFCAKDGDENPQGGLIQMAKLGSNLTYRKNKNPFQKPRGDAGYAKRARLSFCRNELN